LADPVTIGTLAAAALASGAAALGKEVVGTASKDAYAALKAALLPASPSNVEKLEANPEAEHRAISVAEDVDDLDADTQAKIEALAEALSGALAADGQAASVDNRITVIADRHGIAAGRDVNISTPPKA
jgi:predicted Zn-dependent protease